MIEATLGVPVTQYDDGSAPGMHDLEIALPGGLPGAVEVTADADSACIELWNLVNGDDERWQVPSLQGGWLVELEPTARAKALLRELPRLLAELEGRGVTRLTTTTYRRTDGDDVEEVARRLGITRAGQSATTSFPGSIYLTIDLPLERTAGMVPVTGDPVVPWLEEFLAGSECADVRAKLLRSGARERHAFVFVPGFTTAPFAVVDLLMRTGAPIPTVAPALPDEVTHVWAASTWSSGHGVRWSPHEGWTAFAKGGGEGSANV